MTAGWSFRDRAFVSALVLSVLWHCFWFFSVSIVVTHKKPIRPKPAIVSLGPVLDDSIFRTLVETKPRLSETFYRKLSEFSQSADADLEVKAMERHAPGEVVSLPFGKRVLDSIKDLVGGDKISPEFRFASRIGLGYPQEAEGVEGEVKGRLVIDRPEAPRLPKGFETSLGGNGLVLEFAVEADGSVSDVRIIASSGQPNIDLLWENYLGKWRFEPLRGAGPPARQKGRIRFEWG